MYKSLILKLKNAARSLGQPLHYILFPLLLFLFPFAGVGQGVDLTDTTYALTNYTFLDRVDRMWRFMTYLPNELGHLLTLLPGGDSLLGINLYCTLLIALPALGAYFLLWKGMELHPFLVFIGDMIAIALCWCPRVILYNYLSYFLETAGLCLLLYALLIQEKKRLFLLAGFCLGLNVMVRFNNLTQMAFVILVLVAGKGKHLAPLQVFRQVLLCVAGYAAGFLLPLLTIVIRFGPGAYVDAVTRLFAVTGGTQSYTFGGMIVSILGAYSTSARELILPLLVLALATAAFCFLPAKRSIVWKLLFLVLLVGLLYLAYHEGIVTRNYYYYDSVFELAMAFLIMGILLILATFVNGDNKQILLGLTALILILITPLGSNNYTYPVLNNMFLTGPIILYLLEVQVRAFAHYLKGKKKDMAAYPLAAACIFLTFVLLGQGILFRFGFAFGDGDDGTPRDTVITEVPRARFMATRQANAASLEELYAFLSEGNLAGRETISFGGAPGILYLMDLPPALDSAWPDLDSNGADNFEQSLEGLGDRDPLVIVHQPLASFAEEEKKYDMLAAFMEERGYVEILNGSVYHVYDIVPEK